MTIPALIQACSWSPATLLVFSQNVFAPLIYYSHLGPIIASLLIGGFILWGNPRSLVNWALFSVTIFFSIWVYFDLILWASPSISFIMFFWSAIVPIELLIYASSLYLVYLFANQQKDIGLKPKLAIAFFFLPIVLLAQTHYNLLGFDLTNCDRNAIEGPLIQYLYIIEVFFIGWTALVAIRGYRWLTDQIQKRQLLYVSIGTILMLTLFSIGNFLVTYVLNLDWSVEQYKLIGMPIFIAFIAYAVVRYNSFNSKLLTAQVLVSAVAISVLSLLFLNDLNNIRIVAGITTIFVVVLGYLLVRSVKREIEQRELLEQLTSKLEATNERQENLIHFISHEVKGYLTKDQAAFAAILEGDFCPVPDNLKPFVTEALAQTRTGVDSVMNILRASNIKKGTTTYTMTPFDLAAVAADAVEKSKSAATAKGLALTYTTDPAGAPYTMNGDQNEIVEHVLRNLIDNSVNYTPSGSVTVSLKKENGKFVFAVKDTGIGITNEDKARLFTEGGHGKDSQKVNVHSTGYGLFIAKNIVDAHKGAIRAESEGAGKGSTFTVELPA